MSMPLEEYKYDISQCMRCTNCKWMDHVYIKDWRFARICPSVEKYVFDAYACHGKLYIALALIDGKLDFTSRTVDILYKCTLCGACDVMCKRCMDMEPLLVLEALRMRCVEKGRGLPEHMSIVELVEKTGNIYGEMHDNRLKWMSNSMKYSEKADVLYFVGCAPSYRHVEIAKATARILNAAGVNFVVSPKERCCGNILYGTGYIAHVKKLAEHNLKMIRDSGASKVVTSCAACYKTLKVDYPKLLRKSTTDLDFEVLHITEFINNLIKSGDLKLCNRLYMKVTYHDPCQLGRLSEPWFHWDGKRGKYGALDPPKKFRRGTFGIYEPPRDILRNIEGIEFEEMKRIKENSWCCGAGGGVKQAFPDFALWTAKERIKEVKTTGAEAIITACPFCKENLIDAIKSEKADIKVFDIVEIILKALV